MQSTLKHHEPPKPKRRPPHPTATAHNLPSILTLTYIPNSLSSLQRTKDLTAHRRAHDFVPLADEHHRAARKGLRGCSSSSSARVPPVAHERAEVAVRQP